MADAHGSGKKIPEPSSPPPAAEPCRNPPGLRQQHSGRIVARRRWLFRLIALTLVPALFFGLVELVLRVAGYGYPASCFVKSTIEGRDVWIGNPCFSRRFFPVALARLLDRPAINAQKPPGTTRIFVLGSSAAQGDPVPAYGFSRILERLLEERYPNRRFEVVNTGATAINSNVIYPIAKDCARLEPDIFVLYLGNNEVIGPFGPATVFAPFARRQSFIRASLAVRAARTGQLLDALLGSLAGGGKKPTDWAGMEMFLANRIRHDDPRMDAVYDHFRGNVQDICRVGRRAGAKAIVCTVGVNLRDCAPFASLPRPGLSTAETQSWEEAYRRGTVAESAGRLDEALSAYKTAAAIDDTYADLQFRMGRCHEAQAQFAEAAASYSRARDYDALPFRANSRIGDILRDIGTGREADGVYLADVARAFEQDSAHGLPGDALLYEHVHLNFHGNYVIARTVLAQIEKAIGEAGSGAELSEPQCADRLAFTGYDRRHVLLDMVARLNCPPFTAQLYHAESVQRLQTAAERLRDSETPAGLAEAEQCYRRALDCWKDDWRLRESFGGFLLEGPKNAAGAVEQFSLVLQAVPFDYHAYYNLGLALRDAGRLEEAATSYREALRLKPLLPEALCGLGITLGRLGRTQEAMDCLAASLKARPTYAKAHVALGRLLEQQGRLDEAFASYADAHLVPSDMAAIHNRVGAGLAMAGKTDAALAQFAKALKLHPDFPEAHGNAGKALLRLGKTDEALQHLAEAVRLKPDVAETQAILGSLLLTLGQHARAVAYLEKALQLKPDLPGVHNNLGLVFTGLGKPEEAAAHFAVEVKLHPDCAEAHNNLGKVVLRKGDAEAAAKSLREALRLKPAFAEAHANLAVALMALGQKGGAIEHYRQALLGMPNVPEIHNDLGFALATEGRFEEAAKEFAEALRLRPDMPAAQRNLENARARLQAGVAPK